MVKGKSGISAIVATVLIILITVAGVTILWTTIIPMIKEDISFDETIVALSVVSNEGYTVWDENNEAMSVQVKRGTDEVDLLGVQFIFIFEGNSEIKILNDVPGTNQKKTYNFNLSGYGKPTSVSIAPVFANEKVGSVLSKLIESKIPEGEVSGELEDIGDTECSDDADCGDVTSSLTCVGNNVTSRTVTPTCSGGVCEDVIMNELVESCSLGCSLGACNIGVSCLDILNNGWSLGDGNYNITPNSEEFEVYCDMTSDGGGWTRIDFVSDLIHEAQFTGGDAWRWLPNDFGLVLTQQQIQDIQGVSTEGRQRYVGSCQGVIHYNFSSYGYAFGFRFLNGDITNFGQQDLGVDFEIIQDDCKINDMNMRETIININDVRVPVINVYSKDNSATELFGSPLTSNPAWLR